MQNCWQTKKVQKEIDIQYCWQTKKYKRRQTCKIADKQKSSKLDGHAKLLTKKISKGDGHAKLLTNKVQKEMDMQNCWQTMLKRRRTCKIADKQKSPKGDGHAKLLTNNAQKETDIQNCWQTKKNWWLTDGMMGTHILYIGFLEIHFFFAIN